MKTIKTADCVSAYNLLREANLGKMPGIAKIGVIKTIKAIKGIAEEFMAFREDAESRLRSQDHDKMVEMANEWRTMGDGCSLSEEDKMKVNVYFTTLSKELEECLAEEISKEHEIDVRTISEDAFSLMLEANDGWSVAQIIAIQDILVE